MNFTIDQQKAIEVRGKDTLVSASAGSGKTRAYPPASRRKE